MEASVLELAGGVGGVGGLLILILFTLLRRDQKAVTDKIREDRKYMEDRLTKLLEADQETRREHTKALAEMTTLLIRMNGKT